jgi:predicted ATPase
MVPTSLLSLKKADERNYRRLLDQLRLIEKNVEYINFVGGDAEPKIFANFEYKSGMRLPIWSASSGTLRFLALAYVLLTQSALGMRPVIIIEEPENGLYVGYLKDLMKMLTDATTPPQVIFTSHSPYFIDLFDNRLESVMVTKSDEHRSSLVPIDVTMVKERLSEYPLGELHYREMLT